MCRHNSRPLTKDYTVSHERVSTHTVHKFVLDIKSPVCVCISSMKMRSLEGDGGGGEGGEGEEKSDIEFHQNLFESINHFN